MGGGGKEPGIRVSSEALFLLGEIKKVYLGLGRGLGLEDNVYTVCYSEVVSPGCHDATLVGYSVNWFVGTFSASAACFSLRDYFASSGLCFCVVGYSFLV